MQYILSSFFYAGPKLYSFYVLFLKFMCAFKNFLFYTCKSFACMSAHSIYMYSVQRSQKRTLHLQELALQMGVNCLCVLELKPGSFGGAKSAANHWAIFPVSVHLCLFYPFFHLMVISFLQRCILFVGIRITILDTVRHYIFV